MTRIAIAGAAGRMGRNLVLACSESGQLELTQALEREQNPARAPIPVCWRESSLTGL